MKLKTLFIIHAIVVAIWGIGFLLVPETVLSIYGITGTDITKSTLIMSQYLGATFVGLCVLFFLARDVEKGDTQKALMIGGLTASFLVGAVAVYSQYSFRLINLIWLTVAICLFLTLGYVYFLFVKKAE